MKNGIDENFIGYAYDKEYYDKYEGEIFRLEAFGKTIVKNASPLYVINSYNVLDCTDHLEFEKIKTSKIYEENKVGNKPVEEIKHLGYKTVDEWNNEYGLKDSEKVLIKKNN